VTSKGLRRPGQRGERRAIDAIFRALPIVVLPGYSRPLVRAQDYLELVESCRYDGTRVR
jgi:hypothetical protein